MIANRLLLTSPACSTQLACPLQAEEIDFGFQLPQMDTKIVAVPEKRLPDSAKGAHFHRKN